MNDARYHDARDLFLRALDLPTADRPAFVRDACGDDSELCRYVETLLAADDGTVTTFRTGFLEPRAATPDTTRPLLAAGAMIADRYRLVRQLGRGGMGVVWEAEQLQPVRRTVAIKLILPGMDSAAVLARFEAERQALAVMDHPGVARVFDGGLTDDERPYFVMEYVRGVPVTEYCTTHDLALRDRLELFARICEAVQHAHSKAVIHRDLKPTNVLVETVDGQPMPKVIDFGIAKALTSPLTDTPARTQVGQMIGTPEYASPEQADVSHDDVDTRSDVYSLGVMLYELLTGVLPFPTETLRHAGLQEIQRIIREEDPPRPSLRLTDTETTSARASIASSSSTRTPPSEARSVRRALRSDLDWVVMKCLEKNRERRYASPSELAAELRRFLVDEPVLAGPPGPMYRARKFAKRHVPGVVITALLLIALTGITITAMVISDREATLRHAAEMAREEEAVAAEAASWLDSAVATTADTTTSEVLDAAARVLDAAPPHDPRLQGLVHLALAARMQGVGRMDDALAHFADGEMLLTDALGEQHRWVALALMKRAHLLEMTGQYADALPLIPRALAAARANSSDVHSDIEISCLIDACLLYAFMSTPAGIAGASPNADRIASAETIAETLIALCDDPQHALSDEQIGRIHYSLGILAEKQGDAERATAEYQASVQRFRAGLGRLHHLTLGATNTLYDTLGSGPQSVSGREELARDARLALPVGHPVRSSILEKDLKARRDSLPPDDAEMRYEELIREHRAGHGPFSDHVIGVHMDYADWLFGQERQGDALTQLAVALTPAKRSPADPFVRVMNIAPTVAILAYRQGDAERASLAWSTLEEVVPHHPQIGGSPVFGQLYWWSALTMIEHGAPEEAIARLDDLIVRGLSPAHPLENYRRHAEDRTFLAGVLIAYAHAFTGASHHARTALPYLNESHQSNPKRTLGVGRAEVERILERIGAYIERDDRTAPGSEASPPQ